MSAELSAAEIERIVVDQQRVNAWAIEQSAKEWRDSAAGKQILQPVELSPPAPAAGS